MKKSAKKSEKNEAVMKKKGAQGKKNNSDVPRINSNVSVQHLEIRPSKKEMTDEDISTEEARETVSEAIAIKTEYLEISPSLETMTDEDISMGEACGTVPEAKCDIKTEYLEISPSLEIIATTTTTNAPVDERTRVLKPIIDQLFELTVDSTTEQKFRERLQAMTEVLQTFRLDAKNPDEPAVDIDIENLSMIFEGQNLTNESAEIATASPLMFIAETKATLDDAINDSSLIVIAESVERAAIQAAGHTSEIDRGSAINPRNTRGNIKTQTFYAKDDESKVREMLSWLIDDNSVIADAIERKSLIGQRDLNLSNLSDALVDEAVDIDLLAPYFEPVAFDDLLKSLAIKKKKNRFTCGACGERVVNDCVICDRCLLWHHFQCAALKRAPRAKIWICLKCTKDLS